MAINIEPENLAFAELDRIRIGLTLLDARERDVLVQRLGLGSGEVKTAKQIARQTRVPVTEVRRREARARSKLHHPAFAARIEAVRYREGAT